MDLTRSNRLMGLGDSDLEGAFLPCVASRHRQLPLAKKFSTREGPKPPGSLEPQTWETAVRYPNG